jgi:6-phosphofructokinase 1
VVSCSILTAQAKRVNQLYVIGGDGTHRGAYKLAELCWEKGVDVSVAGVPKTIDNDIGADSAWISFNFRTSTW